MTMISLRRSACAALRNESLPPFVWMGPDKLWDKQHPLIPTLEAILISSPSSLVSWLDILQPLPSLDQNFTPHALLVFRLPFHIFGDLKINLWRVGISDSSRRQFRFCPVDKSCCKKLCGGKKKGIGKFWASLWILFFLSKSDRENKKIIKVVLVWISPLRTYCKLSLQSWLVLLILYCTFHFQLHSYHCTFFHLIDQKFMSQETYDPGKTASEPLIRKWLSHWVQNR